MTALAVLCWGGQAIVCFAPAAGVKLGLSEAETEVEPAFWADVRGEALWDFFTLWTLVIAGALLITGSRAWAYFGLVGGGMYVYFAGRGILTRLAMLRRGLRIGTPQGVKVVMTFLVIWGLMGLVSIIAALVSLTSSPLHSSVAAHIKFW